MNRALHALLLIFAFLFAQAGVAAHAAAHIAAEGHSSDQSLPADAGCELCVGYAQLAGAAPLPQAPHLFACVAQYAAPEFAAAPFVSRKSHHSHARAPPVFS